MNYLRLTYSVNYFELNFVCRINKIFFIIFLGSHRFYFCCCVVALTY